MLISQCLFLILTNKIIKVKICKKVKKNIDLKSMNNSQLTTTLIEDLELITSDNTVVIGDVVSVHYTGTLENGTKFDSSLDRGEPFDFKVGMGMVIQGWEKGLIGMTEGSSRKLTIPATEGYGNQDVGDGLIPANSTLVFEIKLLKIN
jgi:FKBP-type peptidyl-prolyl cis-trans isomerase